MSFDELANKPLGQVMSSNELNRQLALARSSDDVPGRKVEHNFISIYDDLEKKRSSNRFTG